MAEDKAEEKVEEKSKKLPVLTMETMMSMNPSDEILQKIGKLQLEHESEIREHPDQVAVCEVSMSALSRLDGIPGHFDLVTGSEASIEHEVSETSEFTTQGLMITDRFETRINAIPSDEWIMEWIIVSREEWEKSQPAGSSNALLSTNAGVSQLMRRATE